MNHDIIVLAGSAGSFEALLEIVPKLPPALPATLFVVMHVSPYAPSVLPELLSRRGTLPASYPLHGEKFSAGHIYVAPPDNHLMLHDGTMQVTRGPKESGHRPAADALFRSASIAYGPRVVGVVLSGYQDCGTAGLMSVKARGGVSIVQSPETAQVPEMPRNVLARMSVDHVVAPAELPTLLASLAAAPAGDTTVPDRFVQQIEGTAPGTPARLVCPICHGVLGQASSGVFEHFRCHTGHTFSLESLVREQTVEMERALWAAVRALEEGAALSERLTSTPSDELRMRFSEKAKTQVQQAEMIRQMLLHGGFPDGLAGAEESEP